MKFSVFNVTEKCISSSWDEREIFSLENISSRVFTVVKIFLDAAPILSCSLSLIDEYRKNSFSQMYERCYEQGRNFLIGACIYTVVNVCLKPIRFRISQLLPTITLENKKKMNRVLLPADRTRQLWIACVLAPVKEECLFRDLLQDRIPRLWTAISSNDVSSSVIQSGFSGLSEKWCRISGAAFLFGMVHMFSYRQGAPLVAVVRQVTQAAFSGLIFGCIRESHLGLAGAIGAHAAHNFRTWILMLQRQLLVVS
ncbi:MAG: CPBP family intramembrane metalloprotease [Chlamydiia bacterium]|nr:CPBP family intramembrane metalloprotease [Chlamydiia bacterium]